MVYNVSLETAQLCTVCAVLQETYFSCLGHKNCSRDCKKCSYFHRLKETFEVFESVRLGRKVEYRGRKHFDL